MVGVGVGEKKKKQKWWRTCLIQLLKGISPARYPTTNGFTSNCSEPRGPASKNLSSSFPSSYTKYPTHLRRLRCLSPWCWCSSEEVEASSAPFPFALDMRRAVVASFSVSPPNPKCLVLAWFSFGAYATHSQSMNLNVNSSQFLFLWWNEMKSKF